MVEGAPKGNSRQAHQKEKRNSQMRSTKGQRGGKAKRKRSKKRTGIHTMKKKKKKGRGRFGGEHQRVGVSDVAKGSKKEETKGCENPPTELGIKWSRWGRGKPGREER